MRYNHIFGPVLSRRLGLSLGIDLVPFKSCSYDCVYCECGHTTRRTIHRQDFFPADEVIAELRDILSSRPHLDTITLAGSGEPTLAHAIGPVIAFVKCEYPEYPLTVLTNGSLLADRELRQEILPADRVIPTLTTVFQQTFEHIHRPHPLLKIDTIIAGMERFREEFQGLLWLEVFIIPGLNTTDEELAGLKDAINRIGPDRVQLNTLDRPAPEGWVEPATDTELERIRMILDSGQGVEITGPRPAFIPKAQATAEAVDLIRATLHRRPSTVEDLVRTTGLAGGEVAKVLSMLERLDEVTSTRMKRGIFYRIRSDPATCGSRQESNGTAGNQTR